MSSASQMQPQGSRPPPVSQPDQSATPADQDTSGASSLVRGCIAALIGVAITAAIRLTLDGQVQKLPFVIFVAPVIPAAYFGGLIAGLFATVMGGLVGWFCFVEPSYTWIKSSLDSTIRLSVYAASGITISLLAELMLRSQSAARRSTRRFKGTFENAAVGMAHVSLDGRWTELNNRLSSILRIPTDGLRGRQYSDLIAAEDRECVRNCVQRVIDGRSQSESIEVRFLRGDETAVWLAMTVSLQRDDRRLPEHLIFVVEDITKRKHAEAELVRERERLKLALDAASMGTWEWNLQTGNVTWSHKLEALSGLAEGEFSKTYDGGMNTVHPDDYQRVEAAVQRSLSTDEPYQAEYRVLQKDGSIRWILGSGRLVRSERDASRLLLGVAMDATARKTAELALEASEARFRTIFEMAASGMAMCSLPDGRFLAVNQKLAEITGYSRSELLDHTFLDVTHPEDRQANGTAFDRLLAGEVTSLTYEKRYVRKDSSPVWVQVTTSLVRDAAGQPVHSVGIIEDITARKRAAEEREQLDRQLRERVRDFETVLETTPAGIVVALDPRCEQLKVNAAFGGWAELDSTANASWTHGQEVQSGYRYWLEQNGRRLTLEEMPVRTAIRENRGTACEFDLVRSDGTRYSLYGYANPIRDDAGQPRGGVAVFLDVTERKAAEAALRESNAALLKANRELEEFAYVASHDLQEPLRMVNAYTQLLLRRTPVGGDTDAQAYATYIRRGVTRMESLIRDLLSYSRVVHSDSSALGTADLTEALSAALDTLQPSISESGAEIASDPLPVVKGDTAQFTHVFQNLLSNSMKYRQPGVSPHVHVSALKDGPDWIISVTDNGIGFDPRYAQRIFGLFKRLHKDEYPGTGLGLAICQRIVERSGGRMWAESEPGRGSSFHFRVPGATWPARDATG